MSKSDQHPLLFEARMKRYESLWETQLIPLLPIMARLDGRAFSRFTKHAKKPFSPFFDTAMEALLCWLTQEAGASVGYTQSDEITLAWYSADYEKTPFFGGYVQKMASTLAAMASTYFNKLGLEDRPGRLDVPFSGLNWHALPTFDCRVWNVPTLDEATNVFIWRQSDAARNSVQMLARAYMSHNMCLRQTSSQLQEKLMKLYGVNWNSLPARNKRGIFCRRAKTERRFTAEEVEKLPPKHQAHSNPNLIVTRTDWQKQDLWLTKFVNRNEILFGGAAPRLFGASFEPSPSPSAARPEKPPVCCDGVGCNSCERIGG